MLHKLGNVLNPLGIVTTASLAIEPEPDALLRQHMARGRGKPQSGTQAYPSGIQRGIETSQLNQGHIRGVMAQTLSDVDLRLLKGDSQRPMPMAPIH